MKDSIKALRELEKDCMPTSTQWPLPIMTVRR